MKKENRWKVKWTYIYDPNAPTEEEISRKVTYLLAKDIAEKIIQEAKAIVDKNKLLQEHV